MHRWLVAGMAVGACMAQAGAGPSTDFPLSAVERLVACAAVEDQDPAHAVALAGSVLEESDAISPLQRAEALACRGWAQATLAARDEASRDAHALRRLVAHLPPTVDRVRLTRRAGGILHRSGDRVGAVELYAQALSDSEAQGLEAERIPLLVNLGVLHSEFEEHERARVNYEQALALMERVGDNRHEAPVRFNLGLNLAGQERFADAAPHLRRALELVRATGVGGPGQEAAVAMALANALQQIGADGDAETLLAEVDALDLPMRDPALRLQRLGIDAARRAAAGDLAGALALYEGVALDELDELQRWGVLRQRAALLEQLGRFAEAATILRQIIDLRESYLRHRNHERLAALETHLRDREQRAELERLQAEADEQSRQLAVRGRLQWLAAFGASLLLALGGAALLWLRRINRRLDRLSRTDALTGVSNRRDMVEYFRALADTDPDGAAVLLVDVDLFKRINDLHGHEVGDAVLVELARRLGECVGAEGRVARWGGEEFLLMLAVAGAEGARSVAEQVRRRLAEPVPTPQGSVQAHVSIGFCNLPLPGGAGDAGWRGSLQLADAALYLAKHAGRDAWAGFWIAAPLRDWPPERLGRETRLARSLGLIQPVCSRPLRDELAAVG